MIKGGALEGVDFILALHNGNTTDELDEGKIGVKYGLSVSTSKLSSGIVFTISLTLTAFLKVTVPEIEIYALRHLF